MATFDPINAALLLVITIVLGWYLKDRFGAVDKRFDRQDDRMDDIAEQLVAVKTEVSGLRGRVDELSREVVGIRADMVQIALAVGARTRPETA